MIMNPRSLHRTTLVMLCVFVLDEVTKTIARAQLPLCVHHGCPTVRWLGILEFARVGNGGSALGFGQGSVVWLLLAAAGVLTMMVLAERWRGRVGLGAALLIGGGAGNLLDRLVFGAVTDFIAVGPVAINLADVALLVGAIAMSVRLARAKATDPPARLPTLVAGSTR
jgi:signal peptidase II